MLTTILLDPRLGFLFLSALLISASIPLAIAWVRFLPAEKPPFSFDRGSETEQSADTDPGLSRAGRDPFAVILLILVTLSYLWQVPGVPGDFLLARVAFFIREPWLHGALLYCRGFFIAIPAVAAAYSVFRSHENRIPLVFAGILVPLLWLTAPWLRASFVLP